MKEILNLNTSKTCQGTDVLTKTLNKTPDILTEILHSRLNACFKKSEFSSVLRQVNITAAFKKGEKDSKIKYRHQFIFCLIRQMYLKNVFSAK